MTSGHHEPGCGYRSLVAVVVLLVAGAGLDAAIGGLRAHAVAWVVAGVVLVAVDLVIISATRTFKTLDVTSDEIRIGEEVVQRSDVASAIEGADDAAPVLGWSSGMPRRRGAVTVTLADGRRVVVPTREPDAVLAALGVGAPAVEAGVRPARPEDVALLPEIDERADALFRVAGYDLPDVPDDDGVATAAAVFVVGDPVVGFASVDVVDGEAHLSEIAVLPGSMKQGLGTALIDAACAWARDAGHAAITLTTYADVPWNAPMYARRGWLPTDEIGPELAAIREREVSIGLDAVGPRIAMRRLLSP